MSVLKAVSLDTLIRTAPRIAKEARDWYKDLRERKAALDDAAPTATSDSVSAYPQQRSGQVASPGTSGCRLNMVAWPPTPPDYSRSLSCAKPRGVRSAFLQIYVDHGQAGPQRQMEQKSAGLRPIYRQGAAGTRKHHPGGRPDEQNPGNADSYRCGSGKWNKSRPVFVLYTDRGRREHENITPEVDQMNRIQGTLTAIGAPGAWQC